MGVERKDSPIFDSGRTEDGKGFRSDARVRVAHYVISCVRSYLGDYDTVSFFDHSSGGIFSGTPFVSKTADYS